MKKRSGILFLGVSMAISALVLTPAGTPTIRGFTIALTMRTTVPDVLELSCDAAKAAIQAADLTTTCNGHNAWVFSQNPAPGTPANAGTPVILSLRNGPRP